MWADSRIRGISCCFTFIVLEAVQTVYFGGLFQRMNSFLVGSLVFGIACTGCLAWVALRQPDQFAVAYSQRADLAKAGLCTALAWLTYFVAIEMIEPAVAFAIYSGAVPLTVLVAARRGIGEASPAHGPVSNLGHLGIAAATLYLCLATFAGLTGFVRGGTVGAAVGILAVVVSGVATTWAMFYCRRLDRADVKANTQFGVRCVPYVGMAAIAAACGLDAKAPVPADQIAEAVSIGLLLVATPSYLVQRAIALVSPLTIGVVGALGPFLVFGLQAIEARVVFSAWTLVGLISYSFSAVLAAAGEALPTPSASAKSLGK
jgi:drug/metabolite transporter (DMT)-like permease